MDLPTLVVPNAAAWRQWLGREAAISKGVWLTLANKGTTEPTSLTWPQAVDEALCYGWIDSQAKGGDEKVRYQRYTPRGKTSIWSARNVGNVERLDKEGKMTAKGWEEVEKAKADGRWARAYAGPATMQPTKEFVDAIAKVPAAQTMWETLNSRNRYAMCFPLANLKTDAGRQKKIAAYVDMLASGQTIHPQKNSRTTSKEAVDAPEGSSKASKRAGTASKKAAVTKAKRKSKAAEVPVVVAGTRRSARLR